MIHRDIKPSNLILDSEGRLRILDFGLARLEGQESLTLSGDLVGTPLYMSPEQARRRKIPVDHRTDIYSLGTTMYEALTGRPPFRGTSHADTLSRIIERDPVAPRKVNARVSGDLETIVLKCLRKDAADRYGTAEALGQDLRRFVRGDPIEARPQPGWELLARRVRRHRATIAGATAMVIVFVLAATLLWMAHEDAYKSEIEDYDAKVAKLYRRGFIYGTDVGRRLSSRAHGGFLHEDFRSAEGEAGPDPVATAVEQLAGSARILRDKPEPHYHRAGGLLLLDRTDEAREAIERALSIDDRFVPALALRGELPNTTDDHPDTLTLKDGARGDADGTANGQIVDPGGPSGGLTSTYFPVILKND